MRTNTGNTIFNLLREHVGQEEAISAPQICRELGWPDSRERLVRRIIADESALWPDVLICSVPGAGYFCAASFQEIESADHWLANLATEAAEKHRLFRATAQQLGFSLAKLPPLAHAA